MVGASSVPGQLESKHKFIEVTPSASRCARNPFEVRAYTSVWWLVIPAFPRGSFEKSIPRHRILARMS